ncbi:MAG: DUF3794 domain-containing protein [Clostridia bacterium]|nr:DUF3794 domain-containing protein [Clostridia bacterium]
MDIETKISGISICETALGCGSEVLAETDVILSEEYPDILRVLQVDAMPVIKDREVSNDRVILKGDIAIRIIYVPDPKISDMPAKSVTSSVSFTDVCEAAGVTGDMKIKSFAEVSNIDYSLINSRKINIKAAVSTEIKAVRHKTREFVADAKCEEGEIETLKSEVSALMSVADEEFVISVSDKLEFPSGSPAAAEMLKVSADVTDYDVRLLAGKAIVKGIIKVGTLYVAKKNLKLEYMEHEIPFTEILELPGVAEDMDADIDFSVLNVYFETDNEEDIREMGVEVTLSVSAAVTSAENALVLTDCFSPDFEISFTKNYCDFDFAEAKLNPQISVKGDIAFGEENPAAERILSVSAKPVLDSVSVNNENITLRGRLKADILYLTAEEEMPLSGMRGEIPFVYTADADGEGKAADCGVTLSNLSYTMGERTVNIRASVSASIKVIGTERVSVIGDIKASEAEKNERAPIVIYFVQSGDTLWNIAKKYKTTMGKIAAANGIDTEKTLTGGEKLLIP